MLCLVASSFCHKETSAAAAGCKFGREQQPISDRVEHTRGPEPPYTNPFISNQRAQADGCPVIVDHSYILVGQQQLHYRTTSSRSPPSSTRLYEQSRACVCERVRLCSCGEHQFHASSSPSLSRCNSRQPYKNYRSVTKHPPPRVGLHFVVVVECFCAVLSSSAWPRECLSWAPRSA